ncbi:MAG: fumarylacetoacetate hydrolase family protein [Rhodoferax sp.]
MKLATYKDGSRDGQLVVVARDLSVAHYATGIAHRLQQVLDDWNFLSPQLQDLYDALNRSRDSGSGASLARNAFPFDPRQCMAPLPRAYQWVNGSAYRSPQAPPDPGGKGSSPALYQGASDDFWGPCDAVPCASEANGIDFEAEVAVITGDVRLGASPAQALDGVRLLLLANALCLRQLLPGEMAQGFGPLQSCPNTAFSPVAVTTDEVGAAWAQGRLDLTLQSGWNGRTVGLCEAGTDMRFHFGQLIAHLCQTRRLRAGAIIGAGAVSNLDASHGYSCIADKRARETLQDGTPLSEFMKFGDTIRIEMKGRDGQSVFGAIEQEIVPLELATAQL